MSRTLILAAVMLAWFALPASAAELDSDLASIAGKDVPELPSDAVSGADKAPEPRVEERVPSKSDTADTSIVLVIVGDTGLSGSREAVRPDAGMRHGSAHAWANLTSGIAAEINGDLNFANLETVVTDRNDLGATEKTFNFRSHPAGVRHLVDVGFNLISTANNHSIDFGERGIRETLRHMGALEAHGLKAHAGLGIDREAAVRPRAVPVKGASVLFSAIGIGAGVHRAGEGRPGQLLYAAPEDFSAVVARLAQTAGAYRILSVHYGEELQVAPDAADVRKLRDQAVGEAGIDLIVGHHAHVAAGVQQVDGKLIFYGLGNFLHLGMQDMSRFGLCRDYGLLARLHLARGADGRHRARAVEAIPLTGMHARTVRLPPQQSTIRVHVLNHLAARLDDAKARARGVRFAPQADGTGLYCAAGAADEAGRVGALCRDWREPAGVPEALARQIASACAGAYVSAAKRAAESGKTSKSSSPFAALFGF